MIPPGLPRLARGWPAVARVLSHRCLPLARARTGQMIPPRLAAVGPRLAGGWLAVGRGLSRRCPPLARARTGQMIPP
eukprot:7083005-Alexandrium_andersonii.AAC.1